MNEKDRIILQMKAELKSLKQNERDYADLNFLLTNLEHRYNLLNDEKHRIESEFQVRNESNLQIIAKLRSDIDLIQEERQISLLAASKFRAIMEEKIYENQSLIEDNQNLANHQSQLENEYRALDSKAEYLQNQVHQIQNVKNQQDKEIMQNLDKYNEVLVQLEQVQNDYLELKINKENSLEEMKSLQQLKGRLEQETHRSVNTLKNQQNQIQQLIYSNQEREDDIIKQADVQLTQQKSVNDQLIQNNEHFQIRIEDLIAENQKLQIATDQARLSKQQSPIVKETDINRQQIQETLKEAAILRNKLKKQDKDLSDSRNEASALKQKLDMKEEMLDQTKRQYQSLKQEVQQTDRKLQPIQDQRVQDLQMELQDVLEQLQQKELSFEKKKFLTDDYEQLKNLLEVSERDYKMLKKINQVEINRNRDLQFQNECKDKELNKIIKHIQDQENEMRQMLKVASENEILNARVSSQDKQIKRFVEESYLVKEYLGRKKQLRENRSNINYEVQQRLDELTNFNTQ